MTEEALKQFLTERHWKLPMVAWGPQHSKIAIAFAEWFARQQVQKTLDQALNEGNGAYRP